MQNQKLLEGNIEKKCSLVMTFHITPSFLSTTQCEVESHSGRNICESIW